MLPLALATELRRRGHDVVGVSERDDLRSKPDEFLLALAWIEQRVIVTENLSDFRRLSAAAIRGGEQHAGVVLASNEVFHRANQRTLGRMVRALEGLLAADPDLTNREVWLSDWL